MSALKTHITHAQKCKGVITDCYVLYIQITFAFLDTSNVDMNVNIVIPLPPLHCCGIFPNVQGFHTKIKICRRQVHFWTITPLQPWHFLTAQPENKTHSG